MKMIKRLSALLLLVLPFTLLTSCNKNQDVSYVTCEINPGVEFVLDAKGKVKTANGLNDDGETLLVDVKLEGKTIEEALEIVVKESEKTGYLIKSEGNNPLFKKDISISVTSNNDKLEAELNAKVEVKVNNLVQSLGLDAAYKKVEAKTRQYLEEIALSYDPSLEGKTKNLTEEQLLAYVELSTIEKAQIASKELEEYYKAFKETKYQMAYKDEIVSALNKQSSIVASTLKVLTDGLDKAIEAVDKHQYNLFVDPNSEYLKALAKLDEYKNKVIELKVSISNNQGDVAALEAQIKTNEQLIETTKATLKGIMDTYNTVLNTLKDALKQAKIVLEETIKKIEAIDYNKILTDYEKKVNELKDSTLAKFEEAHKDDYAAAKARVEARKTELLSIVNNKK